MACALLRCQLCDSDGKQAQGLECHSSDHRWLTVHHCCHSWPCATDRISWTMLLHGFPTKTGENLRDIFNYVIVWCSLGFDLEFWGLLSCQNFSRHINTSLCQVSLLSLRNSKGLKLPSLKFTAFSLQAFMGMFIRITCPNCVACCLTLSQQQRCQL